MQRGEHAGAQVLIERAGEVLMDAAVGACWDGSAMTPDHAMLWLSACKPMTAVAVAMLVERGVLGWDDRVCEWLPGFEQNGKQDITLRHVLTHTGGFRGMRDRYPDATWEQSVEQVCATRLEAGWVVGEDAGYHVHSGWYALGAVIASATRRSFASFIREEVLLRAGMQQTWVTMPASAWQGLQSQQRLAETRDTSQAEAKATGTATLEWCTGTRPGGNAYGPARDLARFYRSLLNESLVSCETLREMTRRQREGRHDRTFRHTIDWGLGFILDSKRYGEAVVPYGYGPHATEATFGHGGAQCAVGMADPTHDLVIAITWNGQPGEARHQARLHDTLGAVYASLNR